MRIYKSNNIPIDFCIVCFPSEIQALNLFGDVGNGPDNRGNCFAYDSECPDYETDFYYCANCKEELKEIDM